ncbi:hypothetical protein [Hwanghaeella sp. 1Z406]|uniref:hypothetical protein n=1 Tax=Hwanghaeella sp. 1Z406 TaxID=3402811 RepID=UPI003B67A036|tara:strand:+ start:2030 stop:2566 length:537 start_codon:yes stop_codon:yes gene_type:complete
MITLTKATAQNGLLDRLATSWELEVSGYGETMDSFPQVEYAAEAMARDATKPTFGIYVLHDPNTEGDETFYGLGHFNTALLPKTKGITLRMVWFTLAPRFDLADPDPMKIALMITSLINGMYDLCGEGDMYANHMKLHLPNSDDRRFAQYLATGFTNKLPKISVAVGGAWLHIDNVHP